MPEEVAEAEAAEVAVEEASPTVEERPTVVETPETPAAAAEEEEGALRVREAPNRHTPVTRHPGMPTCLPSSPAGAIGPMGKVLTIVKNPQHVPGKTFGYLNQTWNEGPTSSLKQMTTQTYINCYTEMTRK